MRQNLLAGINIEDLVAVKGYIGEDHALLDEPLRRLDMPKLKELDPYIRLATYGLFQLPAYQGPAFRGVSLAPETAARYVPGRVVREHAFVCTVANPSIAFPGNTLFVIASVNGRDVSMLADHPKEREVVFFTGTRFKVLAVDASAGGDRRTIYLAEIPDPRLTSAAPPEPAVSGSA